jgi:hypothetical protein
MMRFIWLGAFVGVACSKQPPPVMRSSCEAGACPLPDVAGGLSVAVGSAEAVTHAVMSGDDGGLCPEESPDGAGD